MPYIGFGLVAIICGLLLSLGSDSPDTMERSETFGLLLLAGGVIAVLIGMVTRVVQVNRADGDAHDPWDSDRERMRLGS